MGWFEGWFRGRERHLESAEPERAFAPNPEVDYWPLDPNKTNNEAYDSIRQHGVTLVRSNSGETATLSAFNGGVLLFATLWEPYSAKTIGALKQGIDGGRVDKFGVVLFENSREEIAQNKEESWYFPNAWSLAPSSGDLKPLICRVPFHVFVGPDGKVERIAEGKA